MYFIKRSIGKNCSADRSTELTTKSLVVGRFGHAHYRHFVWGDPPPNPRQRGTPPVLRVPTRSG
jgi:hypothetical protein